MPRLLSALTAALAIGTVAAWANSAAMAEDAFLKEMVSFQGQIGFLQMNTPAMVLGVVRDGESIVVGYGSRAEGKGGPDGDTIIRVGSLSKAVAGEVLASMVADHKVALTDRPQVRLGWPVTVPTAGGREITPLNLVTHGAGLLGGARHGSGQATSPVRFVMRNGKAVELKIVSLDTEGLATWTR